MWKKLYYAKNFWDVDKYDIFCAHIYCKITWILGDNIFKCTDSTNKHWVCRISGFSPANLFQKEKFPKKYMKIAGKS